MASHPPKQHNNLVERAILTTLLYSDLFHFPLTLDEIWQYLVSKKHISRRSFEESLENLHISKTIKKQDGYYCFPGWEEIIAERINNLPELTKKQAIAQKAASYISYIPTILFIGVSGGVAVGNVKPADDIDFFIITKKKTLFITRLLILAVLEMLGLRRKRNDTNPADKICVNLLLEETASAWKPSKRDLYTAHEIVQIQPLFDRENMYERFLAANAWVTKFLPNALLSRPQLQHFGQRHYYSLTFFNTILTRAPIEAFVRKLQKVSIKRHRSRETISNTLLAFHPFDYRTQTLKSLREKAQLLGLLTND